MNFEVVEFRLGVWLLELILRTGMRLSGSSDLLLHRILALESLFLSLQLPQLGCFSWLLCILLLILSLRRDAASRPVHLLVD